MIRPALALLILVLIALQLAPVSAGVVPMRTPEERLTEQMDLWARDIGEEFAACKPWKVGQTAEFLFSVEGDDFFVPEAFQEIRLFVSLTGSETIEDETYYWLELAVPDLDFEMTGVPTTYKLGLLTRELDAGFWKQLNEIVSLAEEDALGALEMARGLVAQVRFQRDEEPGMFIEVSSVWPMLEAKAPEIEEFFANMGPGDNPMFDDSGATFEGDHGKRKVKTPAGRFDSNWLSMHVSYTEVTGEFTLDMTFEADCVAEVPVLALARASLEVAPGGSEWAPDPVTLTLEVQRIGDKAKSMFVNAEEFVDFGVMFRIMAGKGLGF